MDFSKIKTDLNIQRLNAEDCLLPENFESIKYNAYNLMDYLEWDEALVFATVLGEKFSDFTPRDENQASRARVLGYWAMRLTLFVFINLKTAERRELLGKHLLYLLSLGLDVKRALINYLDFFDDLGIVKAEAKILLSDVSKNQEFLGDQRKFAGKNFKPSVENWLKEYQTQLTIEKNKDEPGTFNILKFMDSNEQVKLLNLTQKDILKDLLELYNWLLNPIVYLDTGFKKQSAPSKPRENPVVVKENFTIPKEVLTGAEPKPQTFAPPANPAPKLSLPQEQKLSSNIPTAAPVVPLVPRQKTTATNIPFRPVNIQDILKSKAQEQREKGQAGVSMAGLRVGSGQVEVKADENRTSRTGKADGTKSVAKPMTDIDKKLEELKKKIK